MVVPVERASGSHKIKRYVGNDLNLSILSNRKTLIVAGNNCKVELSDNSGSVKVIGDYCDVTILKGNGAVEYVGNYGKIRLGLGVSEDRVAYIGNGGEITSKCSRTKTRKEGGSSKGSTQGGSKADPRDNHIDISNVSRIRYRAGFLPDAAYVAVPAVRIGGHFKAEKNDA